jgi:hypothetical protein
MVVVAFRRGTYFAVCLMRSTVLAVDFKNQQKRDLCEVLVRRKIFEVDLVGESLY